MSYKTAIIGLDPIGYGMGLSALRHTHRIWGVDSNAKRKAEFQVEGGEPSPLSKNLSQLDAVALVLADPEQAENILFGSNGLAPGLRRGCVVMGFMTTRPETTKALAKRCAEFGLLFLDTPISGGTGKAKSGALTLLASGSAKSHEAARPFLSAIAENVIDLGDEVGNASAMQSVNQMLGGIHMATLAEALALGMVQGVQPRTLMHVIRQSAGSSKTLEDRISASFVEEDSSDMQIACLSKNLSGVLELAKSSNFDAPITQTALSQYEKAEEMGLGAAHGAALAQIYTQEAGQTLPGDLE